MTAGIIEPLVIVLPTTFNEPVTAKLPLTDILPVIAWLPVIFWLPTIVLWLVPADPVGGTARPTDAKLAEVWTTWVPTWIVPSEFALIAFIPPIKMDPVDT